MRRHAPAYVALLMAAVAVMSVPPASAAAPATLEVHIVPERAGIRFELNGQPFVTRGDGIARVTVPAGSYYVVAPPTAVSNGGIRLVFSRWADSIFSRRRTIKLRPGVTRRLQVGFETTRRVSFSYVDLKGNRIDPEDVDEVTLGSSLGTSERFPGTKVHHVLRVARPVRLSRGLEQTLVQYSVHSVKVKGAEVVNRAQQRFYPRDSADVVVRLLFYSAEFSARDAFFGFPIGSGIRLRHPDGQWHTYAFGDDGTVKLPALPRGDYIVEVEAPGINTPQPVALSRNQLVAVKVLSYYDLGALAAFLALLALGLLALGRPHVFRQLRALLPGAVTRPG